MMAKCGMSLEEWNSFETKIKANKDLIKTLKVRLNNANTSGVMSPKSD
jgi:hypothetical protein